MERVVKIHGVGSESYLVKSVHVERGQFVRAGDKLITIESSNVAVDIRSDWSGLAFDVLVHAGDRVKSGNAVLRVQEDFVAIAKKPKLPDNVTLLRQSDVHSTAIAG
jgi:pyruvate/2-oxoglutarate dehydrogenase complex dihydrolipoamide acyltransferase (E2) component